MFFLSFGLLYIVFIEFFVEIWDLSIKNVCPYIFNFVSTDAFIFYYSNVTFASIGQILKNVFPSLTSISFPFKSLYIVCDFLSDFSQVISIALPSVI